ncbi:MAG: hypothetical protein AMJ64_14910 [Betaproteobacteria bacterium SG8_39]|nr:MAG: hypothetical protein AMJ64_14910 [Betaproteobacteria bacterium SG8_39]
MAKCIVLRSTTPYSEEHEPLLRSVLDEQPSLFAVVGAKSQTWEDAMDWLCVHLRLGDAHSDRFCKTTSHTQETLEEVVAFAEEWCALRGLAKDIRVMEL